MVCALRHRDTCLSKRRTNLNGFLEGMQMCMRGQHDWRTEYGLAGILCAIVRFIATYPTFTSLITP